MLKKKLTLKIISFLLLSDILETFTQFCFKKSAVSGSEVASFSWQGVFVFLKGNFFTPYLWLGFFTVFLAFVLWSTILSKIDLSLAVPVASFSYLLVPFVCIIFLGERVSFLRWLGILFIIAGIIFVSFSSAVREEVPL